MFKDALQDMLEAELEVELGYAKGDKKNKADYVVLGVDLDKFKNVLGIWIGENESSRDFIDS